MKRITIEVTEDDIRLGKREDPTRCPIARAVKRTAHCRSADVHVGSWIGIRQQAFKTTERASRFIGRFDTGKAVSPTRFTFLAEEMPLWWMRV